jgi:hypothetical protein
MAHRSYLPHRPRSCRGRIPRPASAGQHHLACTSGRPWPGQDKPRPPRSPPGSTDCTRQGPGNPRHSPHCRRTPRRGRRPRRRTRAPRPACIHQPRRSVLQGSRLAPDRANTRALRIGFMPGLQTGLAGRDTLLGRALTALPACAVGPESLLRARQLGGCNHGAAIEVSFAEAVRLGTAGRVATLRARSLGARPLSRVASRVAAGRLAVARISSRVATRAARPARGARIVRAVAVPTGAERSEHVNYRDTSAVPHMPTTVTAPPHARRASHDRVPVTQAVMNLHQARPGPHFRIQARPCPRSGRDVCASARGAARQKLQRSLLPRGRARPHEVPTAGEGLKAEQKNDE